MDRSSVIYAQLKDGEEFRTALLEKEEFTRLIGAGATIANTGEVILKSLSPPSAVFGEISEEASLASGPTMIWSQVTRMKGTAIWGESAPGQESDLGAWGRDTRYRLAGVLGIRKELEETKNRAASLESHLQLLERTSQMNIMEAGSSDLGLFILRKIGQSDDSLPIDELAANLNGPIGWLAIAHLMRAGLIDDNGRSVYLTSEGYDFVNRMPGLIE